METRESVQNFAPSPKITFFSHVLGCPPLRSRTFASTLMTLQICGLITVVDVDLVTGKFESCQEVR